VLTLGNQTGHKKKQALPQGTMSSKNSASEKSDKFCLLFTLTFRKLFKISQEITHLVLIGDALDQAQHLIESSAA